MAPADRRTSTDRIPLGEAEARLAKRFQSPERLLEELRAGRMPSWDANGNALPPKFWQSYPAVNFKESSARTRDYQMFFVGDGPSVDTNPNPTTTGAVFGITVSLPHVLALLPEEARDVPCTRARTAERAPERRGRRPRPQSCRVEMAIERLTVEVLKSLSEKDRRHRIVRELEAEKRQSRSPDPIPGRNTINRVLKECAL